MLYRICCSAALLSFVLGGTLVFATVTPVEKNWKTVPEKIVPFEMYPQKISFVGKERAAVVCVGKHKTFLGLYIYDQHGNCVAWDDLYAERSADRKDVPDKLAVEWYPPETAPYEVTLVNFGGVITEAEITPK